MPCEPLWDNDQPGEFLGYDVKHVSLPPVNYSWKTIALSEEWPWLGWAAKQDLLNRDLPSARSSEWESRSSSWIRGWNLWDADTVWIDADGDFEPLFDELYEPKMERRREWIRQEMGDGRCAGKNARSELEMWGLQFTLRSVSRRNLSRAWLSRTLGVWEGTRYYNSAWKLFYTKPQRQQCAQLLRDCCGLCALWLIDIHGRARKRAQTVLPTSTRQLIVLDSALHTEAIEMVLLALLHPKQRHGAQRSNAANLAQVKSA